MIESMCECENPERNSYHYRRDPAGAWRCEQCDMIIPKGPTPCSRCEGKGWVTVTINEAGQNPRTGCPTCPDCDGSGLA